MKNRYIQVSLFVLLSSMFAACQSKTEVQPAIQPMDTLVVKPAKAPENQQTLNYRSAQQG